MMCIIVCWLVGEIYDSMLCSMMKLSGGRVLVCLFVLCILFMLCLFVLCFLVLCLVCVFLLWLVFFLVLCVVFCGLLVGCVLC